MTRTVLLRLKSEQLITNQIQEFCYSYDDDNNNNNNTGNNNDNVTIKVSENNVTIKEGRNRDFNGQIHQIS